MQMQIIIDRFLRSEKSHPYKLNAHDRILITMLASYMGEKNICWPSYDRLMIDAGIGSKSTFNKCVQKLERLNLISVERAHRQNNVYKFNSMFLSSVHLCTQVVRKCTQQSTDMYANNINNNIKNKNVISSKKHKDYTEEKYAPAKTAEKPSHLLSEWDKDAKG